MQTLTGLLQKAYTAVNSRDTHKYFRMIHDRPTSCPAPRGMISTVFRPPAGASGSSTVFRLDMPDAHSFEHGRLLTMFRFTCYADEQALPGIRPMLPRNWLRE